jgi:hypothetical protein
VDIHHQKEIMVVMHLMLVVVVHLPIKVVVEVAQELRAAQARQVPQEQVVMDYPQQLVDPQ